MSPIRKLSVMERMAYERASWSDERLAIIIILSLFIIESGQLTYHLCFYTFRGLSFTLFPFTVISWITLINYD